MILLGLIISSIDYIGWLTKRGILDHFTLIIKKRSDSGIST